MRTSSTAVLTVAIAGAVLAGAAGCASQRGVTGSAVSPETSMATQTTTPGERIVTIVKDPQAAAVEAYQRFVDTQAAAQSGNLDPAQFEGVATGQIVEDTLAQARDLQAAGYLIPEGGAAFTGHMVILDGQTATVAACVDQSGWGVELGRVAPQQVLWQPLALRVAAHGDEWIVTETAPTPADLAC
ncbi:hypothetical protein [Cellulomonas sp. P5_C5]